MQSPFLVSFRLLTGLLFFRIQDPTWCLHSQIMENGGKGCAFLFMSKEKCFPSNSCPTFSFSAIIVLVS